jgi:hypothetical protein
MHNPGCRFECRVAAAWRAGSPWVRFSIPISTICMRGSRARLCDAPCAGLHILGIYLCVCYSLYSDGVVYVFYSMVWYVVRYRIVRARVYVNTWVIMRHFLIVTANVRAGVGYCLPVRLLQEPMFHEI